MSTTAIKTPYYYIIKVVVNKSGRARKIFYKIGETAISAKRPNELVSKYEKFRANTAEVLLFENLPVLGSKRIKDKRIHKVLVASGSFVKANQFEVEQTIGESDGKSEFFETSLSEVEVLNTVKSTVAALSLDSKNYTANVSLYDNRLNYDPTKKHLVGNALIKNILEQFPNVYDILYTNKASVVLLVGQFLPDFVASFAMTSKVIIWHDTKDQKHTYDYGYINQNITYIETMEELTNLNIKFNLIIANPPYGKVGNSITETIIDGIEYEEFINLLPLKDYSLKTGKHIDRDAIKVFPPHIFEDADILTHAVRILKNPVSSISTEEELTAAAFTVDKPFNKFMKANILSSHYAIDNIAGWKPTNAVDKTFVFHEFRAKSQHSCGMDKLESKTVANEYNFNNIEITKKTPGISGTLAGAFFSICFNTEAEKTNFVNFYKENRNFINRMIANQFIGVRHYSACWPKVDWTKSGWTIESILKSVAAYTDAEVQEVLNTMDRDYYIGNDYDISRLFGEWL